MIKNISYLVGSDNKMDVEANTLIAMQITKEINHKFHGISGVTVLDTLAFKLGVIVLFIEQIHTMVNNKGLYEDEINLLAPHAKEAIRLIEIELNLAKTKIKNNDC